MGNLVCEVNTKNIPGLKQCVATYGVINGAWIFPLDFTGETFADMLLEATATTNINAISADRMFILGGANEMTTNVNEANFLETNVSEKVRTRKELLEIDLEFFNLKDCLWAKLQSLDNQKRQVMFITEGEAIMTSDNGTNALGAVCKIYVSNAKPPENKDDVWRIRVKFELVDDIGNFTKAFLPNEQTSGSWKPSSKEGIVDVTIVDNGSAVNSLVVDVTGDCDGREITGLVTADFVVTDAAGNTESVTVTAVGNTYTLAGILAADTYTVTLANQPTMTTKGYENQTPVAIAVS